MDMASPFERFQRLEIGFFHLNQIVDIGHVCIRLRQFVNCFAMTVTFP